VRILAVQETWRNKRNEISAVSGRLVRQPVHRSEGSSEQPIGDRIDESQLRRYSELMEDFRRENEAKTPSLPAPEKAVK